MADELSFDAAGTFKNSWNGKLLDIAVTRVTGPDSFKAFVYQCHLNEDIDGSATAYGWNNPAAKNSLGQPNLQKNLHPLENGPVKSPSQFVGLANAASPHQNLGKNHDFSWVGVYSATPQFATAHRLVIDDRDVLESRMPADGQAPILKGNRGYFPVVQQVGATAGYYVSQAMYLVYPGLDDWDQRKYADASVIPYAVWATLWHTLKVEKGNFGLAIRNATGAKLGFLFGEYRHAQQGGRMLLQARPDAVANRVQRGPVQFHRLSWFRWARSEGRTCSWLYRNAGADQDREAAVGAQPKRANPVSGSGGGPESVPRFP